MRTLHKATWLENELPSGVVSTLEMIFALSMGRISCCTVTGLKNAKLGIEDIGVENTKASESSALRKENPAETSEGVDGSAMKDENDALHVYAGDSTSEITGDAFPKLMS